MASITPVKYDSSARKHVPFVSGDTIPPYSIPLDPSGNNLARITNNGLLVTLSAPANVAVQYVSVAGDDSNDGTQASPLRTIRRAVERLPDYTSGIVFLRAGDTFRPSDGYTGNATTLTGILDGVVNYGSRSVSFDTYNDANYEALKSISGITPSLYRDINRARLVFDAIAPTDADVALPIGFTGTGTLNFSAITTEFNNNTGKTDIGKFSWSGPFSTPSGTVTFTGCVHNLGQMPIAYGPGISTASFQFNFCNFTGSGTYYLLQAHGYSLAAQYSDGGGTDDGHGVTLSFNFNAMCGQTSRYPELQIISAAARTYQGLITTNNLTG